MTTRGGRIKAARQRLRPRVTQLDMANATGVGLRTIGRIEAGEAEDSPSLDVLEAYLGIAGEEPAEREGKVTAHLGLSASVTGEPADNPRIRDATPMELLAELAARIAHLERQAGRPKPALPQERVRWYTEDAPSANRERPEGEANRDEAL